MKEGKRRKEGRNEGTKKYHQKNFCGDLRKTITAFPTGHINLSTIAIGMSKRGLVSQGICKPS